MIGVITVILILVFSILITRIASIALTHTGLSKESSKFQARWHLQAWALQPVNLKKW